MIRVRDEAFHDARKRAIGRALAASFADSPLRASRAPWTGDVLASDPQGRTTRFAMDGRGFVGGVVSPMGRRWGTESDSRGRPRSLSGPSGTRLGFDYTADGQLRRIARDDRTLCEIDHDDHGQLAGYTFPDGTATRLTYGAPGQVASVTDRLGAEHAFARDRDGSIVAITDGNGHRTSFDYGNLDRPSRATYPDGTTESYAYDPAGLVRSIGSASGVRVAIERDGAGRPIAIADGEDVARFAYDDAGRVVEATNAVASIGFAYDDAGRVVAESCGEEAVGYEYDEVGTLVAMTYPTGERIEFGRDDDLRLVRVVDWSRGEHRIEHASDELGITVRSPNGLISYAELTPAGQLASLSVREPIRVLGGGETRRGGPRFSAEYAYDDEDRVRSIVDSEHGERSYRYDAEGRVLAVDRPGRGGESFAYDPAGNRTRVGATTATFGPADTLERQGDVACTYDDRGNLASLASNRETWTYRYDGLNRMTRAESGSRRVVTFGYDAFGRRAWKRSGEHLVRFVWAGETLVREVASDGTSRDTLFVPGTPTPLAIRVDGSTVYSVHADHLGAPTRLTDPAGRVAWSADRDAFGATRVSPSSTVANPLRLPGQYFDDETGLHYNRFRYYSPELGRYLTRDPASYHGGLNLYAYAHNDPINGSDPTGLWPSWKTVLTVAAAVAVGVAVVAFAPVALPLAIVLAGAAAGAVGAGLNQGLNEDHFCPECIAKAALKGALVGAVAALPFALLPATAGVAAFAGAGAVGGGMGYTADHALTPGSPWSWGDFAKSAALGGVTGGAGRYLGGRLAGPKAAPVEEPPPPITEPPPDLRRPYIRKPVRAEVEANAPRSADGRPIDPNTGEPIDGTPDLGHKPGHEFRREQAKAQSEGLTQKEFNDRMNDPDLYQLEDPSSNRSHRYEKPGNN